MGKAGRYEVLKTFASLFLHAQIDRFLKHLLPFMPNSFQHRLFL